MEVRVFSAAPIFLRDAAHQPIAPVPVRGTASNLHHFTVIYRYSLSPGGDVMRFFQTFLIGFVLSALSAIPAHAKDSDCSNKSGDVVLNACSKILKTKLYNGKPLTDHQHSVTLDNIGVEYMRRQKFEKAVEYFQSALAKNPQNVRANNNLGSAYTKLDKDDLALAHYNKAIEIAPKYALALSNRAVLYRNKGENEKALSDFNSALTVDPDSTYDYIQRAALHLKLKNYEKSIADFSAALKKKPKASNLYNDRGVAHYYSGNYQEAARDFTEALRLNPGDKETLRNKNAALKKLQQN